MTLYAPSYFASGEGPTYWITEARLNVKFSAKDTGGGYSLIELSAPEGMAIAPHTHTHEDETFIVVSGSFRLFCDGEAFELGVGDCAFLPRGLPHWFEVTSPDFRAMEIVSPGGFEKMLEGLGDLSARPHPPGSLTRADMMRAIEITRSYGHVIALPPGGSPPSGGLADPTLVGGR